MPEPARVLVVDDNVLVLLGLSAVLDSVADLTIVASAVTAQEAIQQAQHLCPDVAIVDIRLPDRSGFEVCTQLRAACPDLPVLIISSVDKDAYLAQAREVGAAGFLLEGPDLDWLVRTLRRVTQGEEVWTREQRRRIEQWRLRVEKPMKSLTERECDVLRLVVAGQSDKEIAQCLGLSVHTVGNHVTAIFTKLNVRSRSELLAFIRTYNVDV